MRSKLLFTMALFVAVCRVAAAAGLAGAAVKPDPVRVKLDHAKAAYTAAMASYRTAADRWFDKEDAAARQLKIGTGDQVRAVAAERAAFDDDGGPLPKRAPAALVQQGVHARAAVKNAYAEASAAYWAMKRDDVATAVEAEGAALLAPPDPRKRWVHDAGTFARLADRSWEEVPPRGPKNTFAEVERTAEFVLLENVNGSTRVKLYADRCDVAFDANRQTYRTFYKGAWSTPAVVAGADDDGNGAGVDKPAGGVTKVAPFSFDGQWQTPRGVVTVHGAEITNDKGDHGRIKFGPDGVLNILWDNTGEGNVYPDPANPDSVRAKNKRGQWFVWTRIKG